MSNYASFQAMSAPDGGTSNNAPEGYRGATINAQPGAVSVTETGTATQRPHGLNTADFTSGSAGILSTARTPLGAPSMGGVKPTDIITVDGFELSVATAEQMGMVTRDAAGRYVEVQGGVEAATAEPAEQEAPADDAEAFAPEAEQALATLCEGVSPSLQVAALQDAITAGEVSATTISRAASESGREPSKLAAEVATTMEHFRAQAVTAVESWGGGDAEDFFDWARTHKPREMKAAMQAHGMERNTRGYQPLFQEYVAQVGDTDPDAVLNASFGGGITARKEGKAVVLNIPGRGEMSYRAALKAGLIRVSGA
ncbi:hypothetical protein [Methylobacterium tarhaniae]|uniref:hypothetical protein n=1 Tax=Methylobacterium tarhaniae TaxID=1187852 RepID=UPI003D08F4F3